MEGSSGPRRSSTQDVGSPAGGADLISALPDEVILLFLARLPCASAAARTGVLSRRWRGLWSLLRQIVFRDVPFPSLEAALGRVLPPPHAVSLLEICVPMEQSTDSAGFNSLLRAAARLEPEKLDFRLPSHLTDLPSGSRIAVDLPCSHRATSISLGLSTPFSLRMPAGAQFPGIEALSLSDCTTELDALLSCCPRLRTLSVTRGLYPNYKCDIRVNSPSLQELAVHHRESETQHVDIVAPALKQLALSFSNGGEISISVLAPMVEKVSWHCCYLGHRIVSGLWSLRKLKLRLQTAERQGQLSSLQIHARADLSFLHAQGDNFTQEIGKHIMVAPFSCLELHLTAKGHAYGGFVFHLLRVDRIHAATRRLKLILNRSAMEGGCPLHCPCEFRNWRFETISLPALEEMEFNGFQGEDHEFDLLQLILGCAPTLKRMVVHLSKETSASHEGCAKIYSIFKACSSVKCDVYHSSGLMHGSQNCPSMRFSGVLIYGAH
ncbi:putative FBD-associated F-box protein At5g56560 [Hordeum vulgare subsp. vulgare]|uniref:F-box/LRR-repeat protein 15/At3g58940/PEG3-like LRR domain-containing protein n=1 Tax=Hordeum vulgare subsp. vulgare TaxID=112509 RepID=A0A8I6YKB8_HORVV|nr:putative FBD-associated F-box protein At5g56560 [Hordeum vulgare subsp. vulgare]